VLAGKARIDGVGDAMGDAPPVAGGGRERETRHLLLRDDIPQPEFDAQLAIGLRLHVAGHERLRIDDAPIAEARHRLERLRSLNERALIDRREQAGAFEIARDDGGNLRADVGAKQIGDGDRNRFDGAAGYVDAELGPCAGARERERQANQEQSADHCDGSHEFTISPLPLIRIHSWVSRRKAAIPDDRARRICREVAITITAVPKNGSSLSGTHSPTMSRALNSNVICFHAAYGLSDGMRSGLLLRT